ncbi:PKD domain-containing protein [Methanolobus sp. WCC4]|uniref:PKD domain-containing protein n=1 Tax=Methanolobus sp. WCC4 TaxID=3125784 RepID=UPI0030F56FF9
MDKYLKTIFAILAVSMLTLGTLTPALAVSPKTYSFEDDLEVASLQLENGKIPVIITFKGKPDAAVVKAAGGDVKQEYTIIPAISANVPEEALFGLSHNPNIDLVEYDAKVHATEQTTPWGIEKIGASQVHSEYANTADGIKVAILDTGIDYNHPDLDDNYVGGYDFVNNDNDPWDDQYHGTHCAGTVAAEDNTEGVVGVAPAADLYALKVLDSSGSGYYSSIISALEWAVENDIDVASMSLSGPSDLNTLRKACDNAYNSGVVLVAAAGNDYGGSVDYPAAYDSVIAVSATNENDIIADFSNIGPQVEIAGPGVNVYSTFPTRYGSYYYLGGTSMATPHVTGTVALLLNTVIPADYDTNGNSNWDPDEVRERLHDTAYDLGDDGKDDYYGYGLVDAYAAVNYEPAGNQAPVASMTITPEITRIGDTITFNASGSTDDDTIVSYTWDFGDGNTGSGEIVTHTYTADNDYLVNLTVVDNEGAIGTAEGWVVVLPQNEAPAAVMTITPETANVDEGVFFDASLSTDTDGMITGYMWNLGDGSSSNDENVTHAYDTAGDYTVELTVFDDMGATNTTTGTVTIVQPNRAPVAVMDMPSSAYEGEAVDFDASASTDPDGNSISYSWNFGDGDTSVEMKPQHTYTTTGTYDVTLTVTDVEGLTNTTSGSITINEILVNEAPTARITMPATAYAGEPVTFDALLSTDDGTIVSYAWDFEDGSGSGVEVVHTYSNIGVYNVSLTVTDDGGLTNTTTGTIEITEAPVVAPVVTVDVEPVFKIAGKNVFIHATATITVMQEDNLISGAIVNGHWEGTTGDSDSATTDASGTVTVDSDSGKYPITSSLDFTFVVDSVVIGETTYEDGTWIGTGSYQ